MIDISKIVDASQLARRKEQLQNEIEAETRALWLYLRAEPKGGKLVPYMLDGAQRPLAAISSAEASLADVEKDISELITLYGNYRSCAEIARALAQEKNKIVRADRNLRALSARLVRDGTPASEVDDLDDVREANLRLDAAKADTCTPDLERRLRRAQEILQKYV